MTNKICYKLERNETITITFVGDSITQGTVHCSDDETFVAVFTNLIAKEFSETQVVRYDGIVRGAIKPLDGYNEVLVQSGTKGRINILRSGVGGNTVARAMNRFGDYTGILPCGERSDFIFLMFGINDALDCDPEKYVTPDVFKGQYSEMIDKVSETEPQAKIIILPATTNGDSIDVHVAKTFEIIKEKNLPFIDTFKLWKEHYSPDADNYGHGDWLVGNGDSCHPTPKASETMAEYIFDGFKNL